MTSNQFPPGRGMTLWERITRDPRYLEGKHRIQVRYGLPLDFNIRLEPAKWSEWLAAEAGSAGGQATRGQAFLEEVQALFKRFQVPEAWQPDFIADIVCFASEAETAESMDDDPETGAQTFPELEKKDTAGTRSRKPWNIIGWVEGLWSSLRKWMKRA